ncbi:MAG: energy transducer TonB [Alphaproteobacteria bacterium]
MQVNKWQLKIATGMQRHDIIGSQHLYGAMFAALLLHVLGYAIWYISPKQQVINIPVRALNIKLGELDTLTEVDIKLLEPSKHNNTKVEDVLSKLVRDQEKEAARGASLTKSIDKAMDKPEEALDKNIKPQKLYKFDMRSEGNKTAAPVMEVAARQFVRDLPPPTDAKEKSGVQDLSAQASQPGNSSAKDAKIIARYEQQISLWIQKFKVYPDTTKQAGQEGETVARIRIDRRGNVRYYTLERSTGHVALDKAAIDMIKRANPVPAAPTNYPAGDVLEFRIPIRFNVQ